jgi:electron transfer flavoprotein beta subunit
MSRMLTVVVPVKYTPDLTSDRRFAQDGTTTRDQLPGVLSELDEYAVEQAVRLTESTPGDATVVFLGMGPAAAVDGLRRALAIGGNEAVHVCDDALHGSDALATSVVLTAALSRLSADLVLCGMASTDAAMGVLPAMLAERMGLPQLTFATRIDVDGGIVSIVRDSGGTVESANAQLPAVVSVTDRSGEVRYPSFKGIMAAKKKPMRTWSLADLDIDPTTVGLAGSRTRVVSVQARPPRTVGTVVKDDGGTGATELHAFLQGQRLL